MACQAMTQTKVGCQLTCKFFSFLSQDLKRNLHNLLTCVYFFHVNLFACETARCILSKQLTSTHKHMICAIYSPNMGKKKQDKDKKATNSPHTL